MLDLSPIAPLPPFRETDTANLLAVEPYGRGQTRTSYEQFTYWDSVLADLQVLEALGIPEAFLLGTSQGGWVSARHLDEVNAATVEFINRWK